MIPAWNMAGIIPPIRPGQPGFCPDRSPYRVDLVDVIDRFATTKERVGILQGLLNYRAALTASGATVGFQWLDGSFMENVEDVEGRAPNDIDVVTFFELPAGETQTSFLRGNADLFDRKKTKATFLVDAFPQVLGQQLTYSRVRQTVYWYSMWSHRRTGLWKGYLEVDLSPANDAPAQSRLDSIVAKGLAP
ncbi:hypothetical protein OEZ49_13235 [Ruegeria sp. WL0004]|uniref:Nucleotidyltransferase family protein n=1 Tax=Ruegeria marisflavi TaxID=2984152 RepID=A0ABT2WS88_9RHOB|nr:hypothetical protein [Ruegeria sp. WL0004]MCU9838736.1 hypothetical protein [Ruegeria sp. WL0004]